jgi:cation diffusion facilitator CzcD-associated flavoprotein CzcO
MDYDAIIVGAGISGLYQLYRLNQLGMKALIIEEAPDVGGTWYWNKYPGCRFDSESYSYCYSFSNELLQEWDWSEHFAGQPEVYSYLKYVTEKFHLRENIKFDTRVLSAKYNEAKNSWTVTTSKGDQFESRFFVTAIGILTVPVMPNYKGRDSFKGVSIHTARWPEESVDLEGKRVAIIGTGATGVQVVQSLSKLAGHLTVFQRSAAWATPLNNSKIGPDEMAAIKNDYPNIFARCKDAAFGFLHTPDPRSIFDATPEEREELFERLWLDRGFSMLFGNFWDIGLSEKAANIVGDFIARKIRQRVRDPKIAEMLIPKDYLFGTKRVPMESGYYEAFNLPTVDLVDLKQTPIERITESGIVFDGVEHPFDVIVYATGFDGYVGGFNRIDIVGRDGITLKERWSKPVQFAGSDTLDVKSSVSTFLGIMVDQFPNLFTIIGPHNGGSFCNVPRCSEINVNFISNLIQYMAEHHLNRVEPTAEGVLKWTKEVLEKADGALLFKTPSWITSVNTNIEGRTSIQVLLYLGTQQQFRAYYNNVVENGYEGLILDGVAGEKAPGRRASLVR